MLKLFGLSYFFVFSMAYAQDMATSSKAQAHNGLTCGKGHDYFQPALLNLMSQSQSTNLIVRWMKDPNPTIQIKPECVESALSQVTMGTNPKEPENNFIRCNNSHTQKFQKQRDACQSSEYKKLVHMSFELVTSCLSGFVSGSESPQIQKNWIEAYFKILAKESGLQVNVVSSSGAIGAGQVISDYVEDFKKFTLKDLQKYLKTSSRVDCRELEKEYLSAERLSKLDDDCAQTDVAHGQPILNLLVSFSNLRTVKARVVQKTFQNPQLFKLTPQERHKLELKLVTMAYNLGGGGLNRPVEDALKDYSPDRPVTDAIHFIQHVHEKIPSMVHIRKRDPKTGEHLQVYKPARVKEMENYLTNVENRYKKVLIGAETNSCLVK